MDRNLALEAVRVTEVSAIAAAQWMGRGNEKSADQAAVDAMRRSLNTMLMDGTIMIGEGERDEAPMLYIGEKVGLGGPKLDIALDPLEGTTLCATGGPNALAVIAFADHGGFLNAPDVYMHKIAVGADLPEDVVDLDASVKDNLNSVAKAKDVSLSSLVVCVLNRPRHNLLIEEIRSLGCRIKLIQDGDVAGVISTTEEASGIDVYMGIGGAPEGILAAAALRCMGGQMQGRLLFDNDRQRERARRFGITDLNRKYLVSDMAAGEVMFAATGVTDGTMLKGVKRVKHRFSCESIVMRSKTGTIRRIIGYHNYEVKHSWAQQLQDNNEL